MSIKAQVEAWSACLPELQAFFPKHAETYSAASKHFVFEPRYDVYSQLEQAGALLVITLRDYGKLIGYWVAIVTPDLRFRDCLTATADFWHIEPEYRAKAAPLILMRAVEREYQARGVTRSFAGENLAHPSGRLFKAFGYQPSETYYEKFIGTSHA